MRKTKKLTLSAMIVALGTAIMAIGAFIDVLDLSACAFASILMTFVFIEIGAPYTYGVWLCTSLATFLFCQARPEIALEYLFVFGIYPILKAYIERLPRALWLIIKLVYANLVIWGLIFFVELVTGLPLFIDKRFWLNAIIYVVLNAAFIAYDIFITVLVRFYFEKLRNRFKSLLK